MRNVVPCFELLRWLPAGTGAAKPAALHPNSGTSVRSPNDHAERPARPNPNPEPPTCHLTPDA